MPELRFAWSGLREASSDFKSGLTDLSAIVHAEELDHLVMSADQLTKESVRAILDHPGLSSLAARGEWNEQRVAAAVSLIIERIKLKSIHISNLAEADIERWKMVVPKLREARPDVRLRWGGGGLDEVYEPTE